MKAPSIGFIGAGTLGKALALSLKAKGCNVAAVFSRSRKSAENLASLINGCKCTASPQETADCCDVVFITTPDSAIAQVVNQVRWSPKHGVIHCSGSHTLEVLEHAALQGSAIGSFHPFQTFACVETHTGAAERFQGAGVAIEGTGWLCGYLDELAGLMGCKSVHPNADDRALYHASAVMSCGQLAALIKGVTDIWKEMGVPEEEARPIIVTLMKTTLANVASAGVGPSMTGPVVRGDIDTVRRHLRALESRLPRLVPTYRSLAKEELLVASSILPSKVAGEIADLLDGP